MRQMNRGRLMTENTALKCTRRIDHRPGTWPGTNSKTSGPRSITPSYHYKAALLLDADSQLSPLPDLPLLIKLPHIPILCSHPKLFRKLADSAEDIFLIILLYYFSWELAVQDR